MTCIVGLVDNDKVWMGGDSAAVAGLSLNVVKDPKVFRLGSLLIGYTTSFRMGQLLKFSNLDKTMESEEALACDPFEAMVRYFVPEIRKLFKKGGFAEKNREREEGGTFLVGYRQRLFSIHSDYQVGESLHPFMSCGCGDKIALGSLLTTRQVGALDPRSRLETALSIAQEFSAGVRAPFTIIADEPKVQEAESRQLN